MIVQLCGGLSIDKPCAVRGAAHLALTNAVAARHLGLMATYRSGSIPIVAVAGWSCSPPSPTPSRPASTAQPQRLRGARLRELIANRRRHAN